MGKQEGEIYLLRREVPQEQEDEACKVNPVLILVLLDVPLGLSNKVSTSKDKQDMSCSCEIMAGVLCFLRAQKSTNLSRGDFTHFVK